MIRHSCHFHSQYSTGTQKGDFLMTILQEIQFGMLMENIYEALSQRMESEIML